MNITRAMVPVLLCFDVKHDPGISDAEFNATASDIILDNLGGLEDEKGILVSIKSRDGEPLDAAIYPSDYPWCDTFANARPDWECSREAPVITDERDNDVKAR